MYNRYIPDGQAYAPVGEVPHAQPLRSGDLLEKGSKQLKGLLKSLKLEKLDSGDLLLMLIVLLLWKEEESTDLLLAFGAALFLGNEEDT